MDVDVDDDTNTDEYESYKSFFSKLGTEPDKIDPARLSAFYTNISQLLDKEDRFMSNANGLLIARFSAGFIHSVTQKGQNDLIFPKCFSLISLLFVCKNKEEPRLISEFKTTLVRHKNTLLSLAPILSNNTDSYRLCIELTRSYIGVLITLASLRRYYKNQLGGLVMKLDFLVKEYMTKLAKLIKNKTHIITIGVKPDKNNDLFYALFPDVQEVVYADSESYHDFIITIPTHIYFHLFFDPDKKKYFSSRSLEKFVVSSNSTSIDILHKQNSVVKFGYLWEQEEGNALEYIRRGCREPFRSFLKDVDPETRTPLQFLVEYEQEDDTSGEASGKVDPIVIDYYFPESYGEEDNEEEEAPLVKRTRNKRKNKVIDISEDDNEKISKYRDLGKSPEDAITFPGDLNSTLTPEIRQAMYEDGKKAMLSRFKFYAQYAERIEDADKEYAIKKAIFETKTSQWAAFKSQYRQTVGVRKTSEEKATYQELKAKYEHEERAFKEFTRMYKAVRNEDSSFKIAVETTMLSGFTKEESLEIQSCFRYV
jgi:uncharacterized protein YeaO (DUF488 family)